jgi:DNA replication protein
MMATFQGYPAGEAYLTPVPGLFFRELLPQIDDLNELKVTVYAFWRMTHKEGHFRYLQLDDFLDDEEFMQGLETAIGTTRQALENALNLCVHRGSLLKAEVTTGRQRPVLYFINSPRGRAAVQAIQNGEWRPNEDPRMPLNLSLERPNIFQLYEENIGPLSPMIADALKEAEATYPYSWIEEGVRIAVERNKRNWRYVTAILERWQVEGRDERTNRRDSEEARRRYAEWGSDESGW